MQPRYLTVRCLGLSSLRYDSTSTADRICSLLLDCLLPHSPEPRPFQPAVERPAFFPSHEHVRHFLGDHCTLGVSQQGGTSIEFPGAMGPLDDRGIVLHSIPAFRPISESRFDGIIPCESQLFEECTFFPRKRWVVRVQSDVPRSE